MSSAQHEAALQEVLVGIAQGKLSWQEKLDAYARAKELSDVLNTSDVRRARATAEVDINQMVSEGKINITRQTQQLMAEAAKLQLEKDRAERELDQNTEQAAFELEKSKKEAEVSLDERRDQAEFDREMQREQEKLRADFDQLKLELDQND